MPVPNNPPVCPIQAEFYGRVFLYLDNRTVTVYADTMNTFKEGDRVTHPIRGIGTVVEDIGSGWFTVKYDKTGERYMTDVALLTLVPAPTGRQEFNFKAGDRVLHKLHGDATVTGVEYDLGLVNIRPDGYPHYKTEQVHPISLIPARVKPEPTFTLTVTDSDGFTGTVGPFPKDQIDAVLTGGFDWSTVESITINRVKD